jgi:hypothetical protein
VQKSKKTAQKEVMQGKSTSIHGSDVCDYVAEMSLELRDLCKDTGQPYLAYLLEIVFSEASDASARVRMKQSQSSQE